MKRQTEPLLFELSRAGRTGYSLPALDVPEKPLEEMLPGIVGKPRNFPN